MSFEFQWFCLGSAVILHLHCIMGDSEVFCPHCKEYVAPRTFRRHKALYCKGERTWDLDVPPTSSSDEESSTPVNYEDDREETSYDEVFKFMDFETEGEGDEEYMEVDLERAKETIEFWEDAIEDIIVDFEEDAEPAASLSIDAEDMDRTYLNQRSLVKWICLFLLFWTAQFQMSDNALELMLRFFNTLFTVCQRYAPWFGGVVMFLPTSVYFLRKRLGLELALTDLPSTLFAQNATPCIISRTFSLPLVTDESRRNVPIVLFQTTKQDGSEQHVANLTGLSSKGGDTQRR